jgi:hypothetical protein
VGLGEVCAGLDGGGYEWVGKEVGVGNGGVNAYIIYTTSGLGVPAE